MQSDRPLTDPWSVSLAGLALVALATGSFTSGLLRQLNLPGPDNSAQVVVMAPAESLPQVSLVLAQAAPPAPAAAVAEAPRPRRPAASSASATATATAQEAPAQEAIPAPSSPSVQSALSEALDASAIEPPADAPADAVDVEPPIP